MNITEQRQLLSRCYVAIDGMTSEEEGSLLSAQSRLGQNKHLTVKQVNQLNDIIVRHKI